MVCELEEYFVFCLPFAGFDNTHKACAQIEMMVLASVGCDLEMTRRGQTLVMMTRVMMAMSLRNMIRMRKTVIGMY